MINQRVYALRMEICKDRNEYGLICVGSEESDTPTCRVLCAKSNLVTLLKTYCLKENVESCNLWFLT